MPAISITSDVIADAVDAEDIERFGLGAGPI